MAPAAAAQQALDNPLSRLQREKVESDDPAEAKPVHFVGQAGDLKRLRVVGSHSFEAKQIVAALLSNFEYQQAARPSADLAALLDTTEKLVREGYLRSGFLDANVTVEYSGEADGLLLKVDEGSQYRTGKLRVVGANLLPVEKLVARLQTPATAATWTYRRGGETRRVAPGEDSTSPFWHTDKPAPGDHLSLTHFRQGIEYALTELGFPFVCFTVGFERAPGEQVVDLVVTISDEGPEGVVNSLTFEGLTRHTEQEMCDFLKLHQGMKFSGAACEEAFAALRNSCRFWRYAISIDCSAGPTDRYAVDPRTVDLHVNVLEYELAPRLGEPLTETDEILIKAAKWLETSWRRSPGIELVSQHVSDAEAEDAEKFEFSIVINNSRGIAARVRGSYQDWEVNIGAIASTDQLAIFDWRSGAQLAYTGAVRPRCDLSIAGNDRKEGDYKSMIKLNPTVKGWSARTSLQAAFVGFKAVVEPVAMLDFGRGAESRTAIDNGILTARDDLGELQVEASTGRILKYRTHAGTLVEFRSGDDEFERLRREIEEESSSLVDLTNSDWPLLSATQFLLGAAAVQPPVQKSPAGEMLCRRGQQMLDVHGGDPLAKSLEVALRNAFSGNADGGVEFAIPQNLDGMAAVGATTRFVVHDGPAFAEEFLPRESWAWTWVRECCFYVVQCETVERTSPLIEAHWEKFLDEYLRQLKAEGMGPIGLSLFVAIPPRNLGERGGRYYARIAYDRFDSLLIDDDLNWLVEGEGALPRLTAAVVLACDGLNESERKRLRDSLGAPLGDLADLLFQRRAANPE